VTLEVTPPSQQSDGFLRIAFVPSGNNLSVAILAGGTTKDITYSLTPSGWNRAQTENVIQDGRLTNIQVLNRPGTFTEQITVQYVITDGSTADIAYTAFGGANGGVSGFLTARYGIANATAWTIAQKVDSFSFVSGRALRDAPTANGLQTVTQILYLTAPTLKDQSLVA
jgi:hypothetical protein